MVPYYAYPDEWMTPAELTREMVRDSEVFHDMRRGAAAVGSLRVEVISVQGIPRPKALAERLTNDIHHKSSGGAVAYLASSSASSNTFRPSSNANIHINIGFCVSYRNCSRYISIGDEINFYIH